MKAFALLLSPTRRLTEFRRMPQIFTLLLFCLRAIHSGASPNVKFAFYLAMSPTRRLAEIRRVPQILMLPLFRLREIRSGASPNIKLAFAEP